MEHYITAISSHCAGSEKQTVHWVWMSCRCGMVFATACTSSDYRGAAQHLSREATRHITEWNQHDQLSEDGKATVVVPRVEAR